MKVRLDWLKDPLLHLAALAAGVAALAAWRDAAFQYDVDPINYSHMAYVTGPQTPPLPFDPAEPPALALP